MKQWVEEYFDGVREWDMKHRLVGKKALTELYRESVSALDVTHAGAAWLGGRTPRDVVVVDVGAGSGLMAMPWLLELEGSKVCFVEPDMKKTAFMMSFVSQLPFELRSRALVLPQTLESVSRETIVNKLGKELLCVVRAFSGKSSLEDARAQSELKNDPFYVFESQKTPKGEIFSLAPLKKTRT